MLLIGYISIEAQRLGTSIPTSETSFTERGYKISSSRKKSPAFVTKTTATNKKKQLENPCCKNKISIWRIPKEYLYPDCSKGCIFLTCGRPALAKEMVCRKSLMCRTHGRKIWGRLGED
ncbi:hypothetical protein NPIL_43151 [Nephila pilipes]|uniref:Uncharacterized protein n=1 Tax=Nephila pilipes TaxID=299642 RepID=A0A8X6UHP5_NEPPI|nr:hypothetical protein NPIL_43151 [Nephila pilipes]